MEKKIKIILYFIIGVFFLSHLGVNAYVASSTNYRIETDTVSFGGGLSTSTNYTMQDSLSDRALGTASSPSSTVDLGVIPTYSGTISITYPTSVSLLPAFKTDVGGQGNGDFDVGVTTDNTGGYTLSISSNTSPALKSTVDNFTDYSPIISGVPDLSWSVASNDSRFGFTPEGVDIIQKYKDDGISCNTGILNTPDACWDSIGTSNKTIATALSSNQPSGATTKIKLRSEAGATRKQGVGSYSAEIVVTALVR